MTEQKEFRLITKTLSGFEDILVNELTALGAKNISPLRRAVEWYGDKELMYKINYCSRLSLVTLKPIKEFSLPLTKICSMMA